MQDGRVRHRADFVRFGVTCCATARDTVMPYRRGCKVPAGYIAAASAWFSQGLGVWGGERGVVQFWLRAAADLLC